MDKEMPVKNLPTIAIQPLQITTREVAETDFELYRVPWLERSGKESLFKEALKDHKVWETAFLTRDLYWGSHGKTLLLDGNVVVCLGQKRRFKLLARYGSFNKFDYGDGEGAFYNDYEEMRNPYADCVGTIAVYLFLWIRGQGFCATKVPLETSVVSKVRLSYAKVVEKTDNLISFEIGMHYYSGGSRCFRCEQKVIIKVNCENIV